MKKHPKFPQNVPTPEYLRRHMDMDWAPRAGSQPRSTHRACERCVYARGKHAEWCSVKGMVKIGRHFVKLPAVSKNPLSGEIDLQFRRGK